MKKYIIVKKCRSCGFRIKRSFLMQTIFRGKKQCRLYLNCSIKSGEFIKGISVFEMPFIFTNEGGF